MYYQKPISPRLLLLLLAGSMFVLAACSSSAASDNAAVPPPLALPVVTITQQQGTVYQVYSASLEGSKDIEIRPQVDGYIERIFVDEGARVRRGQPLFKINDRLYREQVNTAKAALAAAKANLATARINVDKIAPLVQARIVSDVQLKSTQAAYDAALAQVAQAQALVRNAQINLSYTVIAAPTDGYIGRIPLKTGSLVGLGTPEALTVLSELKTVYAYFSLSETDFLRFREQYAGTTLEEKVRQMPPVDLVLADGTTYPLKGKVQLVSGQFTTGTGSISFRVAFSNPDGQLRSGNTGKIRLPLHLPASLVVPQEATYELQDKLFVFVVGDSNKVSSVPIQPAGRSGNYYLVHDGIQPGTKIVYAGLDRLREGAIIQPELLSMDSLFQATPL